MNDPKLKGQKYGNCNRTDCQQPGATYYNYSTRKWYCPDCAWQINENNYHAAHAIFVHDLCLYLPDATDVI